MDKEEAREAALALHRRIAARIRQEVMHQGLEPHSKLPSEVAFARQYGVSRGTVTKALDTLTQEGLIYRRQPYGTFVAPPAASQSPAIDRAGRGQTQGTLPVVGVVLPFLPESFTSKILSGMEAVTRSAGYGLIFAHSENDVALESYHVERLLQAAVSGILLFMADPPGEREQAETDDAHGALVGALQRQNIPLVLIDRYLAGVECDYVVSDDAMAGYAATEHLVALGHQRIGFISHTPYVTSTANRYAGYLECLRAHGLPPQERLVVPLVRPASPTDRHGALVTEVVRGERLLLQGYLTAQNRLTAVVCVEDYLGLRLLKAAEEMGLRVPDDLAVVGCGPGDVGAQGPVPLTSIVQPAVELGQHAARILLDRIAGRSSRLRQVALPVSLVVRQSCGGIPRTTPLAVSRLGAE